MVCKYRAHYYRKLGSTIWRLMDHTVRCRIGKAISLGKITDKCASRILF